VIDNCCAEEPPERAPGKLTTPKRKLGALFPKVTLALIVLAGCGPNLSELRTRAAFDLECSEEQLSLAKLRSGDASGRGAQYGVTGCGKRSVYVNVQGAGWVNDTAGGEEPR